MSEVLRDPARLFERARQGRGGDRSHRAPSAPLAARVLAAAGARLILAAGNATRTRRHTAASVCSSAPRSRRVARRPNTEEDCELIMQTGLERFGALDMLVVGSGLNDVSPIVDMSPGALRERDARQCHGGVAPVPRIRQARHRAGSRRQGRARFLGTGQARSSRRLQRVLRLQGRNRRTHQGAGMRMGQVWHHRQRHRAHRVPLSPHGVDVRG